MLATRHLLKKAVYAALPKAGRTIVWLLKIIIPISFVVSVLHYFGITAVLAHYLAPVFSVVGLPGDVAIAFITSIFLPLYAPIAIITTLPISPRDVAILAVMCLIAHNLIVETAVQSKTGSNYAGIFLLRIVSAFVVAFFLNLLLPKDIGAATLSTPTVVHGSFLAMTGDWAVSTFWLALKIILIITSLMLLQNILKEFKVLDKLSKSLTVPMKVMGLPANCSFLWIVAHVLGLAYGAAIMIDAVENKEISREEANLFNHHIAVNHSTLEDTFLFASIGVPILWMIVPRFIMAIVIVWFVRFLQYLRKRQLKFGKTVG